MPRFGRSQRRFMPSGAQRQGKLGLNGQRRRVLQPPQIASNVAFGHTYRFLSTSATATGVTVGSLFGAAGTVCNAANSQVVSFIGAMRVTRVRMWTPPAAQGSAATCSIDWVGAVNSSNREVSDTTVSTAMPAHVDSVPPSRSLAEFWSNGSNAAATLFTLIAPVGTVIDVTMSLILYDEDANDAQVGISITTGTLGLVYYLSLDPNATHRYTPVSLTTTT